MSFFISIHRNYNTYNYSLQLKCHYSLITAVSVFIRYICSIREQLFFIFSGFYYRNKNVDIKFSAHDVFLELPASGTLKIERFESQII